MPEMQRIPSARRERPNTITGVIECALSACQDGACTHRQCFAISQLGTSKVYRPGDAVFLQGDAADSYFLIKSGAMRGVRFLEDGRRQVTRFAFPGDLVVHKGSRGYIYGGEAITRLEVEIISREKLDQLVGRYPCLADIITHNILSELREAQDQLLMIGQLKAEERVAHFLCKLKERLVGDTSDELYIPMSRSDIADFLGLTIETVSRVMSRLKRQGKISLQASNKLTMSDLHNHDHLFDGFAA